MKFSKKMKPNLRIKLSDKSEKKSKSTNWRHSVKEDNPDRYEARMQKEKGLSIMP